MQKLPWTKPSVVPAPHIWRELAAVDATGYAVEANEAPPPDRGTDGAAGARG